MIRYRLICGSAPGEKAEASSAGKAKSKSKAAHSGQGGASKAGAGKAPSRSVTGHAAPAKGPGCGQEFESWFQSSDAFEKLVKRGQVSCPGCGSRHVEKALMTPSVNTTKGKERCVIVPPSAAKSDVAVPAPTSRPLATLTPQQRAFVDTMRKVREHVLATSENVGKKFVEEARKMHYEEAETRSIHGEASIEQAKALAEEGIDVFPIPELPDDRN